MSNVRVNQRHESGVQYLDTARELAVHTLSCVKRMPKSYRLILTMKLSELANDIYTEVCIANSIYPKSPTAVAQRAQHLNVASGKIDALDGLAGIALDCIGIKDKPAEPTEPTKMTEYAWVHLGELLDKEKALINKVLKSDAKLTF